MVPYPEQVQAIKANSDAGLLGLKAKLDSKSSRLEEALTAKLTELADESKAAKAASDAAAAKTQQQLSATNAQIEETQKKLQHLTEVQTKSEAAQLEASKAQTEMANAMQKLMNMHMNVVTKHAALEQKVEIKMLGEHVPQTGVAY